MGVIEFVKEFPQGTEISLSTEGTVFKFLQEDYEEKEDYEELKIKVSNEGGGNFYVLETKKWSIDSVDDLKLIIDKINHAIDSFSE